MSIDEGVIKATQDSLSPLIKKPPLTPKLLSKPPFRFLHDIVTGVKTKAGYAAAPVACGWAGAVTEHLGWGQRGQRSQKH